jgi:hypothetical protein
VLTIETQTAESNLRRSSLRGQDADKVPEFWRVLGEHSVLGTGATKVEALGDLRNGAATLVQFLKEKGEPLPQSSMELVSIEVAA